LSQTLPTALPISAIVPEAVGIKTLVFKDKLDFMPGQFVMLWLPRVDEKPFGIWRMKTGEFRITVSAVGTFSKKLHELKVGDKVGIRGPFGKGFTISTNKKIALVGGGFGTAPLLGLLQQAKNCQADVIIGARSKNLIFGEEYAKQLGANVYISTNDGSCGEKCFNTQLFEKLLKQKKYSLVYSCGPELMMKTVAEICAKKKIPCELSLERYMKCGFGICGSCAIDNNGWRVCKDGPVIAGKDALKLSEFGKYHRDSAGTRLKI